MAGIKLTEGSIREIMRGAQLVDPVVQVLASKKITSSSSDKERFRLMISDGKHVVSSAMLTTQLAYQVANGEIPMFSIIKIKKYITSVINNSGKADKRVLVILDTEIMAMGSEVGEKIGDPEQMSDDVTASSTSSNTTSSSHNKNQMSTNVSVHHNAANNDHATNLENQLTQPITSLTPYQNKWVIKAKVQFKSPIRTWSNAKGEGKLFSMDVVDESGEIRVTGFRDSVDKFYNMIEVDKVYYISKCQLKVANKQFTTLKNDYEMTLTNDTIIQECDDDLHSIPKTKYDFLAIDKLAHIEAGTLVDVIGICKLVSDVQTLQARSTGKELKKRDVTLVDQTLNTIDLTLWGTDAENFDGSNLPVITLKSGRVSEFGGGKSISTISNTIMKINPDIPEAHQLKGWCDNGGLNNELKNISARSGGGGLQTQWMSFREVSENGIGNSERGDYYQTVATILLVKSDNCVYKACPTDDCNKKIVDLENGMFRCEKCNREFPNFKYRLLASMNLADWSGNQWVSVFSNECEKVLETTSEEVGRAMDSSSQSLSNILEQANFRNYLFKFRAKMETYNDESRLKTIAVRVDPVDYKQYNAYKLAQIEKYLG